MAAEGGSPWRVGIGPAGEVGAAPAQPPCAGPAPSVVAALVSRPRFLGLLVFVEAPRQAIVELPGRLCPTWGSRVAVGDVVGALPEAGIVCHGLTSFPQSRAGVQILPPLVSHRRGRGKGHLAATSGVPQGTQITNV
jgi:hypothetical protein